MGKRRKKEGAVRVERKEEKKCISPHVSGGAYSLLRLSPALIHSSLIMPRVQVGTGMTFCS